jgi:hypothetical protein
MPDPWNHLTDYAALEARLTAPSADLGSALSDAGLDGIGLARLRARWNARFAADRKLEDAFEAESESLRSAASAPVPPAPSPPVEPPSGPAPAPFVLRQTSSPIASPWINMQQPAMPARPQLDIDKTSFAVPVARAAPLPFGAVPSREFVAAMSAPAEPKLRDEAGETAFTPVSREAGPALPFQETAESVPPNVGAFTLEQYASLAAELAVDTTGRAQTLTRYGLGGEDDLRELHRVWGKRFKQQPDLRATWVGLVSRYGEWLRSSAKR